MELIRERLAGDLDGCVRALRAVYEADGYPLNWPADPRGWLEPPGLLGAWVCGDIDGHVAVHELDGERAEVTRLFVAPAARRRKVGRTLVEHVKAWAAAHGRSLVLEVVADEQRSAAIALYEATGWRHMATVQADWTGPDGGLVQLRRYEFTVTPR